ncbi:hypothetical protein C5613_22310 [Rhodococcus opacus]|uniref:Uncharacterized protein n=1 Tax=Rhodococcus opacus TaxID=37919 RepID=A0A2S8J6V0_RHOOP|nr:hypothetical protein C5613_22310 [Rhodococcus opacus]
MQWLPYPQCASFSDEDGHTAFRCAGDRGGHARHDAIGDDDMVRLRDPVAAATHRRDRNTAVTAPLHVPDHRCAYAARAEGTRVSVP